MYCAETAAETCTSAECEGIATAGSEKEAALQIAGTKAAAKNVAELCAAACSGERAWRQRRRMAYLIEQCYT
jgi:hypothetical protein